MPIQSSGPRQVCNQCRGNLLWDAPSGYLRCQRCDALQQVDEEGLISEHALEAALAERRPRGPLGSGTRLVRCSECRAEVELPDEVQASRCEFCGSSLLMPQEQATDHYQPESLVPFAIDRANAARSFQTWLGKLWLRPSNLRRASSLKELHGIYIPYWAFGCAVTSSWSADAGYTEWTEARKQKREAARDGATPVRTPRTRWEPCAGQRHDSYEDHLICASRGLASELHGAAQRFDTGALLPYSPEYLLGFSAERYAIDLREAWQSARRGIGTLQERLCAGDVPGDSQRSLRASHKFESVRFKHVLLPIWIAAYHYRGQLYRFMVNGQTGEVAGRAPLSTLKVALVVITTLALTAALFYYFYGRPPQPLSTLF